MPGTSPVAMTEANKTKVVCDLGSRGNRGPGSRSQRDLEPRGAAGNWVVLQHPATHEQVLFYTLSDLPELRLLGLLCGRLQGRIP